MTEFVWPVRVYYEDTDAGGVVYHTNYIQFMERARTEWLRALGYEQDHLMAQAGILFAVRRLEVDYIQPARFNDALTVITRVDDLKRASLYFVQRIVRAADDVVLCTARVQVACLSTGGRPMVIPNDMREKMQHA